MALINKKRTRGELSIIESNARSMRYEIRSLEKEREEINSEIESLLAVYKKLTGNGYAVKDSKKVGKTPKDYSYWNKHDV